MDNKEEIITLRGDDGLEHSCQVLGMFEFEQGEYALVLNLGPAGEAPAAEPEPVLLRVETQDGQATFHMIDDNDEFERVKAYCDEAVAEMENECEADEES